MLRNSNSRWWKIYIMLRNSARNLADGKGRWTCPGALFRPGEQNILQVTINPPHNTFCSWTSQASTDWSRVYVPVSHFGHRPWHWQLLVGQVYCNFLGFSNGKCCQIHPDVHGELTLAAWRSWWDELGGTLDRRRFSSLNSSSWTGWKFFGRWN